MTKNNKSTLNCLQSKSMKGQKAKNQQHQHNNPTIFSISIFQSPEEFVAVYLALESDNEEHKIFAGRYLEKLLHRTKSPPIALTYTKEFTLLRSESQIQLTIIRFISQLSDLSAGKSMQSSLSFIIDNSSFLTELRHNLTHRVMVKGLVIERGKEMILKELKEKYWKIMFEKVWKTYFIDREKVENIFSSIIKSSDSDEENSNKLLQSIQRSHLYRQYVGELQNQQLNKLSFNYLFKHCHSNYEFKSLFKGYVLRKVLPEIMKRIKGNQDSQNEPNSSEMIQRVNNELLNEYFSIQSLSESTPFHLRSIIMFSTLLDILLSLHKYEELSNLSQARQLLTQIIIVLINQSKNVSKNQKPTNNNNKPTSPFHTLCSPILMNKLRQVYLLKYIEEYNGLINSLPQEMVQEIKKYWSQKQIQMGKQLIIDF